MKRKIIITGLCLSVLLSAGWVLRAAQQQTQKINTVPGTPLRVEPAKESDTTGKTVAAAKAFLATLEDAGRAKASLAFNSNALDATQQKQAILPYQVGDLVLGPTEDGKTIEPEGIKVSALNAAQKEKLLDIVHEWVGILNDEAAAAKMAEIKANLPETWFAWSGAITPGSGAYYRIQGPTLLIEFSPQRGDTNHVHTIYRDPTNDYGARLVKR